MTARQRILQRLHAAQSAHKATKSAHKAENHELAFVPSRFVDNDALLNTFCQQAHSSGSQVRMLDTFAQLTDEILSHRTVAIPDPQLFGELSKIANCSTQGDIVLVKADAAIAETGSVCIHSGQVNSSTLFLCEHLLVLIEIQRLVPYLEDYASASPNARATHIITGPSRTADVEQTIQIGAHGPREMSCLLLGRVNSETRSGV